MFFLRPCCDASTVVSSAMDDVSVLPGASDLIVVKHKNGKLKKTLLLVCFGPLALLNGKSLGMVVNNNKV